MTTYTGFHAYEANGVLKWMSTGEWKSRFDYTFYNHFHPFVGELLEQLNRRWIDGLLDADFHASLEQHFFKNVYQPNESDPLVGVAYFPKEIDVSEQGPYSIYNWELLFHVPLTIAVHLSKNQRFAEAQRWFHYIFDPTSSDGRFWRFLGFRKEEGVKQIDALLRLVSKPDDECSDEELALKELVLNSYEAVRNHPFQPHAVARTRFLAYRYCVVMKYLDNLIAWGDTLFRQDTIETLGEATQIYVLAANILGPRPERIPQHGRIRPKTFAQLRAGGLDELGNALVELEGQFPFNLYHPATEGVDTGEAGPLFGIGRTLYFCIPQNDKLLGYWDTVSDRLFKIRHCMNIEGVVRQLPLFQPPIDPGMLVKAAAAGIDISSLVSGLNQPLAPIRSAPLIHKALELCNEVRGLGGALLSALEKQDGEALARLRQKHEINIQRLAQDVRFLQWKEAEAATDALVRSPGGRLGTVPVLPAVAGTGEEELAEAADFVLERRRLTEENFDEVHAELVEQYARAITLEGLSPLELKEEGRLYLLNGEYDELNGHADRALAAKLSAAGTEVITGVLSLIPTFHLKAAYWGIGADARVGGGDPLAVAGRAVSLGFSAWAQIEEFQGQRAHKTASYLRRADDWVLQSNLAALELMQIGQRVIVSLIREELLRHEYDNLKKQIEQAQEIDAFLQDKFTGAELYGWMQGELSKLYYEYYKFAFDIARKAEQTMKHELMRPELDDLSFIKFNYWDGGRKGLLAGEALHLDVKRMEMAYHDHNKREYELTKNISLRQVDPLALLELKATGRCEVSLPEWLFDLDGPGHYMRRIKSVGVTIPAVAGPYTSINCTLSLLKSTLRRSPVLKDGEYARAPGEDDRFIDYYGTIESIVTSNAQNDSGMFEVNLRDERFLPFEGAGAVSTWRLALPAEFRQFDYNTIPDVILHLRYTARQGGELLGAKAAEHLRELIEAADTSGLARLFSLKHDFPTEWHRFLAGEDAFAAAVTREDFPYFVQGEEILITAVDLYTFEPGEELAAVSAGVDVEDASDKLKEDGAFELSLAPDGTILRREPEAEVFLLVRYALG